MDARAYKTLSIKEFTKAAEIYDSENAGIYELCKDDYLPILEELEQRTFHDLLDVGKEFIEFLKACLLILCQEKMVGSKTEIKT